MTDDKQENAIANIEGDILNLLKAERARPTLPLRIVEPDQTPPAPLPVDDIGHMAADAVLKVYEATAQKVEAMGDEVKERIAKLAAALNEADEDLKLLASAAAAIRDKGAAVAELVQQAAKTSKVIRDLAADFRDKVNA
jgi:hypothetical protein